MTDTTPGRVLRRKAEAGRSHSGSGAVTPDKALGQALARAAQDMMKLPLRVTALHDARMSLAEVTECLPERAFLALVEGPEEGLGLMALAPELLASLIEMQTTGRISAGTVMARRPTRTDAAMSAPFIDRVMSELELALAADIAITWAGGFRYATYLEDPRPLGLLLDDTGYRVFRLTLQCGDGEGRSGALLLALPAEGRGAPPKREGADTGESIAGSAPAAAAWAARMEAAVLGARTYVEAVLDRPRLPLSQVLGLEPGSLVPLPAGVLTRLRVEGHGQRLLAYGKLGQCQGKYAVRLLVAWDDSGDAGPGQNEYGALPAPIPTARQAISVKRVADDAPEDRGRAGPPASAAQ